MRIVLFILLYGLSLWQMAKAQIDENFEVTNLSEIPHWVGETNYWEIQNEQLKSKGPTVSPSQIYLATSSTLAYNTQWTFHATLKVATSSNIYADIFLTSNQENIKTNNQGYFVRIGDKDDDVSLWRKDNETTFVKIIDGKNATIASSSNNQVIVKVIRNKDFNFQLWVDYSKTGNNFTLEGEAKDDTYKTSNYFGIIARYTYSASNNNNEKFFFDNINVSEIIEDKTPPKVLTTKIVNPQTISVVFSESLNKASAETLANYHFSDIEITSVQLLNNNTVQINLAQTMTNKNNYTLTIQNVQDLAQNPSLPFQTNLIYYTPQMFDILINEIMADPDPPQALPNFEYIEVFNNSPYPINLNGFQLSVGNTTRTLPDTTILAQEYAIITSPTAKPHFDKFGKVIAISLPALTNSGQTITLKDSKNNILHSVTYADTWYQNNFKQEGGWSLEQIDVKNPCAGADNWRASTSNLGGTPGSNNAIANDNKDIWPPFVKHLSVKDSLTILLTFNETILTETASNTAHYIIDNEIGQPIKITNNNKNLSQQITLHLDKPLQRNVKYSLKIIAQITDCVGNKLTANNNLVFAMPQPIAPNDLIINEILFYANTNGTDYLEIYNKSNKWLDVSTLKIVQKDTLTNEILSAVKISEQPYLLAPQQFLCLSANENLVKNHYNSPNPQQFLNVPNFPNFNSNAAWVLLTDSLLNTIDDLKYSEKMHFRLLNSLKGVALERLSYFRPSHEKSNWHSAAQQVNYGTPAYQNSQIQIDIDDQDNTITLQPEAFSPDNDGFNDLLNIHYQLPSNGYVGNVIVYNHLGKKVKQLVSNELLGTQGVWVWDGLTDSNQKAPLGIYIVFVELFDLQGNVKHYKKNCVVSYR